MLQLYIPSDKEVWNESHNNSTTINSYSFHFLARLQCIWKCLATKSLGTNLAGFARCFRSLSGFLTEADQGHSQNIFFQKKFKSQCFWEIIFKQYFKSKNYCKSQETGAHARTYSQTPSYKSETSLKTQESLSNPEKYFGITKIILSRDTYVSSQPVSHMSFRHL